MTHDAKIKHRSDIANAMVSAANQNCYDRFFRCYRACKQSAQHSIRFILTDIYSIIAEKSSGSDGFSFTF